MLFDGAVPVKERIFNQVANSIMFPYFVFVTYCELKKKIQLANNLINNMQNSEA